MSQADTAPSTGAPTIAFAKSALRLSYALGMIAALPEWGPRWLWRPTRGIAEWLYLRAPHRGRCHDGYDRVSDAAVALLGLLKGRKSW